MERRAVLAGLAGLVSNAVLTGSRGGARTWILEGQPVSHAQLSHWSAAAWNAFNSCHYQELSQALPHLIERAQAACESASAHNRVKALALLADSYVLTSELHIKLGDDHAAHIAAKQAFSAAKASGDPIIIASAARAVAIVLRRQSSHDQATSLLTSNAHYIAGCNEPMPEVLAAYGSLLCTAAYSSAQSGKLSQANELIGEASRAATQLEAISYRKAIFSSTNVTLYQIGIQTVLGDSSAALDYARHINTAQLRTSERQARFYIDTARAWEQYGRADRAFSALLAAEARAPQEIRRPSIQRLVSSLLTSSGPLANDFRSLAIRTGAV